jgi:hypothetical protein
VADGLAGNLQTASSLLVFCGRPEIKNGELALNAKGPRLTSVLEDVRTQRCKGTSPDVCCDNNVQTH